MHHIPSVKLFHLLDGAGPAQTIERRGCCRSLPRCCTIHMIHVKNSPMTINSCFPVWNLTRIILSFQVWKSKKLNFMEKQNQNVIKIGHFIEDTLLLQGKEHFQWERYNSNEPILSICCDFNTSTNNFLSVKMWLIKNDLSLDRNKYYFVHAEIF